MSFHRNRDIGYSKFSLAHLLGKVCIVLCFKLNVYIFVICKLNMIKRENELNLNDLNYKIFDL